MSRVRCAGLLLLLLWGCPSGEPEDGVELRSSAILVETEQDDGQAPGGPLVPSGDEGDWAPENSVIVSGHVEPSLFAEIRFEVPGRIARILAQPGAVVREGDVLAVLETGERQARLDEARRRLRDARAAVPGGGATRDGEPLPVWLEQEMRERLEDAAEQASFAASDRAMVAQAGAIGGEEAATDMALRLARARNTAEGHRSGVAARAAGERLAAGLADDLAARVRQLEDAIDRSTLTSPMAGVVVRVGVHEGAQWNTRAVDPAFEVLDPGGNVVRAAIPVQIARVMQPGEPARVHVEPGGATVPASVLRVEDDEMRVTGEDGEAWTVREVVLSLAPEVARTLEVGQLVQVAVRR